jgi:hypothetical protein
LLSEVSPQGFNSKTRRVSPGAAGFFFKVLGVSVVEVPPSQLLEEAVDIAWVYLQQTGELGDGHAAARFLTDEIEAMVRRGQRNRMFLANMAIIISGIEG